MTFIQVENIEKKFGTQQALNPTSLEIEEGEFVVFVGPSGCGKTTFLRLIAGLEEVSAGKIIIDQKDVTWIEPKNRGVAMVFQNYALYPHLTVEKNLLYPLNILKLDKGEKTRRVNEVSEMLEIKTLLNRKPSELSGGQKQRVAIGRALVRQPRIFLFDEPLSNLDARLREQMRIEILSLHQKLKRTTIYVTHDQHEAMTLSERLVVMNHGNIIQAGKPLDLYKNPKTLFVAQFLGNPPINTITGRIKNSKIFESEIGSIELSKIPIAQNGELILGVRPEDFTLANDNDKPCLKAKVRFVEHLGREVHLRLEVNNHPLRVVTKDKEFKTGETVFLQISSEKSLWFSPETQERIYLDD